MTHTPSSVRCRCSIIPPWLLRRLARSDDLEVAARAARTLQVDLEGRRARRTMSAPLKSAYVSVGEGADVVEREIFDARQSESLPGVSVRVEGEDPTGDLATDEAYDGFGAVWAYWRDVHGRSSIDDEGMTLLGTVHYGKGYDNAFWDGERMIFGDGDGEIFGRFTASLDVIGHELAHGVTQHTAGLLYSGQSGALNEHVSDVFGALVKQKARNQTAKQADWLIGAELLRPGVKGVAIRNMLAPGTAYDDPELGHDPQPDHMDGYVRTTGDNGGVHLNSGIPNRAFAVAARACGGRAWQTVGPVWYDVLDGDRIQARCDFATFAALTLDAASARHGAGHRVTDAIAEGWQTVGVVPEVTKGRARGGSVSPPRETPPGGPSVPPEAEGADLRLRRTGGFAGLVKQRETTLDQLPHPDALAWASLLTTGTLSVRAAAVEERPRPDAFCYDVRCRSLAVDVSLPEHALTESERTLFQRTLAEAR